MQHESVERLAAIQAAIARAARDVGRSPADITLVAVSKTFPPEAIALHGQELGVGVFVAAGDDPARCRESVRLGWASTGPDEALVGS